MTDQPKPNLTSDQEIVSEYTLTDNFIQQYKKYRLGMLEGGLFSDREQQAMTASLVSEPEHMFAFISNCTTLLLTKAIDEFDEPLEAIECLNHFNSIIYQLLLLGVVPLLKMTPEEREEAKQAYLSSLTQKKVEDIDAFSGLDFDMQGPKPQ